MRHIRLVAASVAAALFLVASAPAQGQLTPIPQPDATYVATTRLLPITEPDFTTLNSLSDSQLTLSFDIDLVALTVPTTWSSWGSPPDTEGSTPRVLWTNGFPSLTITSSDPLTLFGIEAQPNTAFVSPITASFFKGSEFLGEILLDVDGLAGARLFAASSVQSFDTVVVSSTDDFAIAQVRVQAIPEPGGLILSLLGIGLISVYGGMRRARMGKMRS